MTTKRVMRKMAKIKTTIVDFFLTCTGSILISLRGLPSISWVLFCIWKSPVLSRINQETKTAEIGTTTNETRIPTIVFEDNGNLFDNIPLIRDLAQEWSSDAVLVLFRRVSRLSE